ncbi:PTS fructose transporter subunit IIA [Erysipelotrichaceae bacterium]|nr:PTS fructose transporter subunit IIA [Erysipelotrichaceae bacterium]
MLFSAKMVYLDLAIEDKDAVMHYIAEQATILGVTTDEIGVYDALMRREAEYSTAFGGLFAIPHAKTEKISDARLLFIRLKEPIAWESPDDFEVQAMFVILVPEVEASTKHLEILAQVAVLLLDDDFKKAALELDAKAIVDYIQMKVGGDLQ